VTSIERRGKKGEGDEKSSQTKTTRKRKKAPVREDIFGVFPPLDT